MTRSRLCAAAAVCALIAGAAPVAALAQSSGTAAAATPTGASPAATAAASGATVEEVVVQARKRGEQIQDVPIAVTALSASFIEHAHATSVTDLAKYVPNVQLSSVNFSGGTLAASIRGIQFADLEKTFDPTVGVTIDGLFLATSTGAVYDLSDVEQIEVLRGPQGTLYGRNTIGGTINIRRTRPTDKPSLKLTGSYGSYDNYGVGIVANTGTFANQFALKLYAFYKDGDSFTENYVTGIRDKGVQKVSYGGSLSWRPNSKLDVLLSLDAYNDDSFLPPAINLTSGADAGLNICKIFGAAYTTSCITGSGALAAKSGYTKSFAPTNYPFRNFIDGYDAILEANLDVGQFTLTSITSYLHDDEALTEENTGTLDTIGGKPVNVGGVNYFVGGVPLFAALRRTTYHQQSQEFRITSKFAGKLNFVAGAYLLGTHYRLDGGQFVAPGSPQASILFAGAPAGVFTGAQNLSSYAVFGEGTYNFTDQLRMSVGGRYTYETKDFTMDRRTNTGAPAFVTNPKRSFGAPTGRITLDYKFTPTVMAYGGYSRGFRSGGFNGRATTLASASASYEPENVDSFETGLRTEWYDRRLRINPTFFYTLYNNKQEDILRAFTPVSGPPETSTVTDNAAGATLYGVEIEGEARPIPRLVIRFAASYLHTEFDEFIDLVNGVPTDIAATARLRRAPEWTASLGAEYTFVLAGDATLQLEGDFKYTDDYFVSPVRLGTDPLGRDTIAARNTFDFSATYTRPFAGGVASLSAYVKDAFADEDGRVSGTLNAGLFWFGVVEPTRLFGVQATYKY